jgi:twinkle protein
MNHITEFQNLGIILKRQHGNVKTKCPKCSHTRKNKRDLCLSVNIDDGLYNCHNCGWNGNVKFKKKKEFIIPEKINLNITDRIRKWFKKRAISESTISHYKIGESFEYIPQVQAKRKCINFNYYRDEEIINIKFRDSQKNFKLVSGAELIFYGLNNIKNIDRCYIVEGEIDCMSLHEIGLSNVCSVPNGASKGNQRLEYLDNC